MEKMGNASQSVRVCFITTNLRKNRDKREKTRLHRGVIEQCHFHKQRDSEETEVVRDRQTENIGGEMEKEHGEITKI